MESLGGGVVQRFSFLWLAQKALRNPKGALATLVITPLTDISFLLVGGVDGSGGVPHLSTRTRVQIPSSQSKPPIGKLREPITGQMDWSIGLLVEFRKPLLP